MSLPRLITQFVMVGVNILSKGFVEAYARAKAGGGSASAAAGVSVSTRMPVDQARQVLNLEAKGPLSRDAIGKQFTRYYDMNDPDKGGSFYLQSKVFYAKEALMDEARRDGLRRRAPAPQTTTNQQ